MTDTTESWHLDKRVPMATILVLCVQLAGGVWFASQLSARVDVLARDADRRENRIAQVELLSRGQAVTFATLEARLSSVQEALTELKDVQRETNTLLREWQRVPQ